MRGSLPRKADDFGAAIQLHLTSAEGQILSAAAIPGRRSTAPFVPPETAGLPASTAAGDIHSAASWSARPTSATLRRSRFRKSSGPTACQTAARRARAALCPASCISPCAALEKLLIVLVHSTERPLCPETRRVCPASPASSRPVAAFHPGHPTGFYPARAP